MKIGVVTFPGSNSDVDSLNALRVAGVEAVTLWHESPDLGGVSAVILPGGFAYGDYIRAGVIARFSPVMGGIKDFAAQGGLVLGICNGFQVLAEAGLVPGALLRNRSLRFAGRLINIKPERLDSPFTSSATGALMRVPVAHGEGCYYADEATLDELERDGQVLFRYVRDDGTPATDPDEYANPNGSLRAIAGVSNKAGNVAGLMPHPERMAEGILGTDGGMQVVLSLVESAKKWEAAGRPKPTATSKVEAGR
ncbi:MAG TPA: phosphoribosylformylglycinamidine synthase subunit PurQ [Candidatus Limnocylindrales bacterium]